MSLVQRPKSRCSSQVLTLMVMTRQGFSINFTLWFNGHHLTILQVSWLTHQYGLYLCRTFTMMDPPPVAPLSAYVTSYSLTLALLRHGSIQATLSRTFPLEKPFQRTNISYDDSGWMGPQEVSSPTSCSKQSQH